MTKPSMEEAAKIRDVAARHSYVFDNGLCHPDFFDVDKRMASEEFGLLLKHCEPEHRIREVGCLTGLNLLGMAQRGYTKLHGIDFVGGAIDWLSNEAAKRGYSIGTGCYDFPMRTFGERNAWPLFDRAICFDVIEHQLNVGLFLQGIGEMLMPGGQCLILVPPRIDTLGWTVEEALTTPARMKRCKTSVNRE